MNLIKGLKKVVLAIAFCITVSTLTPMTAYAATDYTVTPYSATLYTGAGAEYYTSPEFSSYQGQLNGNLPVTVTGLTSNYFYQTSIGGVTYYIPKKDLATCTNTTAYKFATFDSNALLVGNTSGQLYYQKSATAKVAPASTTKILTAMLTIEAINAGTLTWDTPVVVSSTAISSLPSDASHMDPKLQAGEVISVGSLLQACLIKSDCQACNVLATAVSGSVDGFVALMNSRVRELGCTGTNFTNPSGYPDDNHYTTAYDMYLIACQAYKYPLFDSIIKMSNAVIPATNMSAARTITNTNSLIDTNSAYYNANCVGGKTGTANSAGYCLVAFAVKDNKSVVSVVMGGKKSFMSDGSYCYSQYYDSNRLLAFGLLK